MALGELSVSNHDRDVFGLKYVYPVVSRRAGGVSVGINLNPNNACNWACVYCQVPNLTRGNAPPIDLGQLRAELRLMLQAIVHGSFLQDHVPEAARRLNDIAFSGNGEPTSASCFADAVELVGAVLREFGLQEQIKLVLISNGSLIGKPAVQDGLRRLAALGGEIWFKLDRGSAADMAAVNQVHLAPAAVLRNLLQAAQLCPTWVQSCFFAWDGAVPAADSVAAYLQLLADAVNAGAGLRGVLLYGLARPSLQPQAPHLSPAPLEWMQALAEKIQALGLQVKLSA